MKTRFLDRLEEVNLLKGICQPDTACKVCLVKAESGWGKTILLQKFMSEVAGFDMVLTEFKSSPGSLVQLLSNICDSLGWHNFPSFRASMEKVAGPIKISHNLMLGENRIEGGSQEQGQDLIQIRREILTEAFFADLRTNGNVILIFDVYERIDNDLGGWMQNTFLPYAQRSKNVRVLIAGKEVPTPSIEWEAEIINLEGIDLPHWKEYAKQDLHIEVSDEVLVTFWRAAQGHPLRMQQLLQIVEQGR